jgi:hypothetical protein
VEERLAALAARRESLWPGTRLVLLLRHHVENGPSRNGGLLSVLDRSGWAPELPHRCDPLPGDARATPAWRAREGILAERLGETLIGLVLAKKLQPADLERTTSFALSGQLEAGYFPPPADGRLPLPGGIPRGEPFSAGDLAPAFGVSPRDAMPLLDELLASGALVVVEHRGVS